MARGRWLGLILVIAIGTGFVGIGEAQAKKNLLNSLFPYVFPYDEEIDGGDKVADELKAPFSVDDGKAKGTLGNLYDPTGTAAAGTQLAKPHRHHKQIADWLLKVVADSLTVDPTVYEGHIRGLSKTYNRAALKQYHEFMVNSQTLAALKSQGKVMRTYVNAPLLLNQAALEGRYRWLYEIPATMSLVPKGLSTYEGVIAVNHKVLVQVQVGRIVPAEGQEDIIIESFSVMQDSEE